MTFILFEIDICFHEISQCSVGLISMSRAGAFEFVFVCFVILDLFDKSFS